jgi:serine/threonine-protein kinase RsbW
VGDTVKLRLHSRIAYVDLVHAMAEKLARRARFPKPEALDIALAVREAFINAVKHGNGMDDAKLVEVEFQRNASQFRIWVRDQGPGFDWEKTADPRDEENLVRTSGRGIFFMRSFVDSVIFENLQGKGTQVLLEKKLEAPRRGHEESGRHR